MRISERTRCCQDIFIELDRKSAEGGHLLAEFMSTSSHLERRSVLKHTVSHGTIRPRKLHANTPMLIQSLHPIVFFPLGTLKACVEQPDPISATGNCLRASLSPGFDNKCTRIGLKHLLL